MNRAREGGVAGAGRARCLVHVCGAARTELVRVTSRLVRRGARWCVVAHQPARQWRVNSGGGRRSRSAHTDQ